MIRRTIVQATLLAVLLPSFSGGCAVAHGIDTLASACPPAEFGRPLYVRAFAGTGAWIGGIAGGIASVVILPITYPISLLADDGLGENGQAEFLFAPALGGASVGHALLGGAADVVDYTFRRAWVGENEVITSYEFVPAAGPGLPPGGPGLPPGGPGSPPAEPDSSR